MDVPKERYSDDWQEAVHRECTDPLFFLETREALKRCRARKLTPEQRFYLHSLEQHFEHAASAGTLKKLWGLPSKRRGEPARRHILEVIGDMCATGFARYGEKNAA